MLSGIFALRAMRERPLYFLTSRVGSIAWPYFLWEFCVRTAVLPFAAAFTHSQNVDLSWQGRLMDTLTGHLSWFLWTLFVMQVLLVPVSRLSNWMLLLVSVPLYFLPVLTETGPLRPVLTYLPYLMAGATLVPPYVEIIEKWGPLWRSSFALLLFGLLALLFVSGGTHYRAGLLVAGLIGSLGTIALVYGTRPDLMRMLAGVGTASLAIYILHPYFQRAASEGLLQFGQSAGALQLAIPTFAGVVGPLVAYQLANVLGLEWLFRLQMRRHPLPSGRRTSVGQQ